MDETARYDGIADWYDAELVSAEDAAYVPGLLGRGPVEEPGERDYPVRIGLRAVR